MPPNTPPDTFDLRSPIAISVADLAEVPPVAPAAASISDSKESDHNSASSSEDGALSDSDDETLTMVEPWRERKFILSKDAQSFTDLIVKFKAPFVWSNQTLCKEKFFIFDDAYFKDKDQFEQLLKDFRRNSLSDNFFNDQKLKSSSWRDIIPNLQENLKSIKKVLLASPANPENILKLFLLNNLIQDGMHKYLEKLVPDFFVSSQTMQLILDAERKSLAWNAYYDSHDNTLHFLLHAVGDVVFFNSLNTIEYPAYSRNGSITYNLRTNFRLEWTVKIIDPEKSYDVALENCILTMDMESRLIQRYFQELNPNESQELHLKYLMDLLAFDLRTKRADCYLIEHLKALSSLNLSHSFQAFCRTQLSLSLQGQSVDRTQFRLLLEAWQLKCLMGSLLQALKSKAFDEAAQYCDKLCMLKNITGYFRGFFAKYSAELKQKQQMPDFSAAMSLPTYLSTRLIPQINASASFSLLGEYTLEFILSGNVNNIRICLQQDVVPIVNIKPEKILNLLQIEAWCKQAWISLRQYRGLKSNSLLDSTDASNLFAEISRLLPTTTVPSLTLKAIKRKLRLEYNTQVEKLVSAGLFKNKQDFESFCSLWDAPVEQYGSSAAAASPISTAPISPALAMSPASAPIPVPTLLSDHAKEQRDSMQPTVFFTMSSDLKSEQGYADLKSELFAFRQIKVDLLGAIKSDVDRRALNDIYFNGVLIENSPWKNILSFESSPSGLSLLQHYFFQNIGQSGTKSFVSRILRSARILFAESSKGFDKIGQFNIFLDNERAKNFFQWDISRQSSQFPNEIFCLIYQELGVFARNAEGSVDFAWDSEGKREYLNKLGTIKARIEYTVVADPALNTWSIKDELCAFEMLREDVVASSQSLTKFCFDGRQKTLHSFLSILQSDCDKKSPYISEHLVLFFSFLELYFNNVFYEISSPPAIHQSAAEESKHSDSLPLKDRLLKLAGSSHQTDQLKTELGVFMQQLAKQCLPLRAVGVASPVLHDLTQHLAVWHAQNSDDYLFSMNLPLLGIQYDVFIEPTSHFQAIFQNYFAERELGLNFNSFKPSFSASDSSRTITYDAQSHNIVNIASIMISYEIDLNLKLVHSGQIRIKGEQGVNLNSLKTLLNEKFRALSQLKDYSHSSALASLPLSRHSITISQEMAQHIIACLDSIASNEQLKLLSEQSDFKRLKAMLGAGVVSSNLPGLPAAQPDIDCLEELSSGPVFQKSLLRDPQAEKTPFDISERKEELASSAVSPSGQTDITRVFSEGNFLNQLKAKIKYKDHVFKNPFSERPVLFVTSTIVESDQDSVEPLLSSWKSVRRDKKDDFLAKLAAGFKEKLAAGFKQNILQNSQIETVYIDGKPFLNNKIYGEVLGRIAPKIWGAASLDESSEPVLCKQYLLACLDADHNPNVILFSILKLILPEILSKSAAWHFTELGKGVKSAQASINLIPIYDQKNLLISWRCQVTMDLVRSAKISDPTLKKIPVGEILLSALLEYNFMAEGGQVNFTEPLLSIWANYEPIQLAFKSHLIRENRERVVQIILSALIFDEKNKRLEDKKVHLQGLEKYQALSPDQSVFLFKNLKKTKKLLAQSALLAFVKEEPDAEQIARASYMPKRFVLDELRKLEYPEQSDKQTFQLWNAIVRARFSWAIHPARQAAVILLEAVQIHAIRGLYFKNYSVLKAKITTLLQKAYEQEQEPSSSLTKEQYSEAIAIDLARAPFNPESLSPVSTPPASPRPSIIIKDSDSKPRLLITLEELLSQILDFDVRFNSEINSEINPVFIEWQDALTIEKESAKNLEWHQIFFNKAIADISQRSIKSTEELLKNNTLRSEGIISFLRWCLVLYPPNYPEYLKDRIYLLMETWGWSRSKYSPRPITSILKTQLKLIRQEENLILPNPSSEVYFEPTTIVSVSFNQQYETPAPCLVWTLSPADLLLTVRLQDVSAVSIYEIASLFDLRKSKHKNFYINGKPAISKKTSKELIALQDNQTLAKPLDRYIFQQLVSETSVLTALEQYLNRIVGGTAKSQQQALNMNLDPRGNLYCQCFMRFANFTVRYDYYFDVSEQAVKYPVLTLATLDADLYQKFKKYIVSFRDFPENQLADFLIGYLGLYVHLDAKEDAILHLQTLRTLINQYSGDLGKANELRSLIISGLKILQDTSSALSTFESVVTEIQNTLTNYFYSDFIPRQSYQKAGTPVPSVSLSYQELLVFASSLPMLRDMIAA